MKKISLLLTFAFAAFNIQAQNCPLTCNDQVTINLDALGMATFSPDDIGEGIDPDCEPFLQVALTSTSGALIVPYGTTINFDCTLVGQHIGVMSYIENGSVLSSCWGNVTIEDPSAVCPTAIAPGTVPVQFTSMLNGPYANKVFLNGNELNKVNMNLFELPESDVFSGNNTLTFESYAAGLANVSTLDQVIIMRILQEIQTDTDRHYIAADIDRSNFIGIRDLVKIRKIILGIESYTNSYAFIHPTVSYPNLDPFDFGTNVYEYNFDGADVNTIDFTFEAFQGGDMQGFTSNPSDTRSGNEYLSFEDVYAENGVEITIPFTLESSSEFSALQLALSSKMIEIKEINSLYSGSELWTNSLPQETRFSFIPDQEVDEFAFDLTFVPKRSGYVSELINLVSDFDQELATIDLDVFNIKLASNSTTSVDDDFESQINIFPNPANDRLNIVVSELHEDGFNYSFNAANGSTVISGYNINKALTIDVDQIESGFYILTIDNGGQRVVEKIVIK